MDINIQITVDMGPQSGTYGFIVDDPASNAIAALFPADWGTIAGAFGGSLSGSSNGRGITALAVKDNNLVVLGLQGASSTSNLPDSITINTGGGSQTLNIADVVAQGAGTDGNYYFYWDSLNPIVGADFSGPQTVVFSGYTSDLWQLVDDRAAAGNFVLCIAIQDANIACAVNFTNEILRTADGGDTWGVAHTLGTAGSATIAAGNGSFVIGGTHPFLFTSVDGGLTWTDTTPVGFNSGNVVFLPGVGVFVVTDSNAQCLWVSADGTAWTQITCASIGLPGVNIDAAEVFAAEGAGVAVLSFISFNPNVNFVQISSPDGFAWTLRETTALAPLPTFPTRGPVVWNGTVFYTNVLDQNGNVIGLSSPDGIAWTLLTSGNPEPPYTDASAAFGGDLYTSSFSTNTIAVSTDEGATWAPDTVPDCTYVDLLADGPKLYGFGEAIAAFNGATWSTELGPFITGFIDRIFAGFGLTLACGATDAGNGAIWKLVSAPVQVEVPPVVGQTFANATSQILGASLVVGVVTTQPSLTVPVGSIISQSPQGGTLVDVGSAVDLVRSSGFVLVPEVEKLTASAANAAILAAGLSVGEPGTIGSDTVPYGSVVVQDPPAGTHVLPGALVTYKISVPSADFNVDATVISQYANSPTILRLVHNMAEYLNKNVDLAKFYQYVWNVDTAVGFGLDIWGKIVGVSRLLQIPGNDPIVGFDNTDVPKDWYPMSEGRFAIEGEVTTAYELPDDAYRVLILTKALANIVTTTAPALNRLLKNMFPGRGRCFVRDLGNMAMQFVFNFRLTTVEYAILTQSGVLPHPAGVFYSVVVIPGGLFGFQGYTGALPFNFGVFNSRPP